MEDVLRNEDLLLVVFGFLAEEEEGEDEDPLSRRLGREGRDRKFSSERAQGNYAKDLFYDDGGAWLPNRPLFAGAVQLVCRRWHRVAERCLQLCEARAFDQRKHAVWERLARRQAARAKLSVEDALSLDQQLEQLLRQSDRRNTREVLQNGRLNALLEAGASTDTLSKHESSTFNLADLLRGILRSSSRFTRASMGDFVVLEELICSAGKGLGWCFHRAYMGWGGEEIPHFVLTTMTTGTPWGEPYRPKEDKPAMKLSRRSFGVFRTMLLARLYHATTARQQPAWLVSKAWPGSSHSYNWCLAENLEDLNVLLPMPGRRLPILASHVLAHLARLRSSPSSSSFSPSFTASSSTSSLFSSSQQRVLTWDVLRLLEMGGFLRGVSFPPPLCSDDPFTRTCLTGFCSRHLVLPNDPFLLQALRFHLFSNIRVRMVEDEKEKQFLVEALQLFVKKNLSSKPQRNRLKGCLNAVPELRGWMVEGEAGMVLMKDLCRMRCRELLEFFLREEGERMKPLLGALVEYMRSTEVRGCKHKLIRMLEKRVKSDLGR
ncbi:hypothetical protein QOT17_003656 [Balamuthia mandrillaris]